MYKNKKINNKIFKYFEKNNKSKYTILFLHGFGSSNEFAKNLYDLDNKYNIVSINMLNNKKNEVSLKQLNDVSAYFLKKIKNKRTILFCHSLGGGLMSKLWNNKKVKKIVWMSTIHPFITSSISYKTLKAHHYGEGFGKISQNVIRFLNEKKLIESLLGPVKNFIETDSIWSSILKETIFDKKFLIELDETYKKSKEKSVFLIGENDKIIDTNQYIKYIDSIKGKVNIIGEAHNPIKTKPIEINNLLNGLIDTKVRFFKKKVLS